MNGLAVSHLEDGHDYQRSYIPSSNKIGLIIRARDYGGREWKTCINVFMVFPEDDGRVILAYRKFGPGYCVTKLNPKVKD